MPTSPTAKIPTETDGRRKETQKDDGGNDNIGFAVFIVDHGDDEEDDLLYEEGGNVAFDSPDFDDVRKLIELSLEDADIGTEHKSKDEVK